MSAQKADNLRLEILKSEKKAKDPDLRPSEREELQRSIEALYRKLRQVEENLKKKWPWKSKGRSADSKNNS
jgi:hypothetical protein